MSHYKELRCKKLTHNAARLRTESERCIETKRREDARIKSLAETTVVEYTQVYAEPEPRWIFSQNMYRQYTRQGEIAVTCMCNGCGQASEQPKTENHCKYCTCVDCVCNARKHNGQYAQYVMTPY